MGMDERGPFLRREIEVYTNEHIEEQKASKRDPIIFENLTEFSDEQLKEAMTAEMRSLESFDTKEDVPLSSFDHSTISTALTLLWVFVWKGFVKGRLCVRGYFQVIKNLDDVYVFTPIIYILRVLRICA